MKKNFSFYFLPFIALLFFASCGKKKPTSTTPNPPPYQVTTSKSFDSASNWLNNYDTLTTDGNFLAVLKKSSEYWFLKINQQGQVIREKKLSSISNEHFHILEPSTNSYILFGANQVFKFDQNGNELLHQTISSANDYTISVSKQPIGLVTFINTFPNYNIKYIVFDNDLNVISTNEKVFNRINYPFFLNNKIICIASDSLGNSAHINGPSYLRYDMNFNLIDSTHFGIFYPNEFVFSSLVVKVLRNNDVFWGIYNPGLLTGGNIQWGVIRDTALLSQGYGYYSRGHAFTELENGQVFLFRGSIYPSKSYLGISDANHLNFTNGLIQLDSTFSKGLLYYDGIWNNSFEWPNIIQEPSTSNKFIFGHTYDSSIFRAVIYKINDSGLVPF